MIQFVFPLLPLDEKMRVLARICPSIRNVVTNVTGERRQLQFYFYVYSEIVKYAHELSPEHNLALQNLRITTDWHTARTIITSAQFITKLKPFTTLRGVSKAAK